MSNVFVNGNDELVGDFENRCKVSCESAGGFGAESIVMIDVGDQCRVLPDRHAVFPPVATKDPARQRFARIPFALTVVQKSSTGKSVAQFLDQDFRQPPFVRSDGSGIPFFAFHVVDGNEGRFATHCQTHVAFAETLGDFLSEFIDGRPL